MMIWPLPALLSWALAWVLYLGLSAINAPTFLAWLAAAALGLIFAAWAALRGATRWRQCLIGLGFPLSLAASGAASDWPAWWWLLPLALLLLLYPLRSWRDAPLFPTPRGALLGLAQATGLSPSAKILDAGCGLGDGLLALRQTFPQAQLTGLECSSLLQFLCRLRCALQGAGVTVVCSDMWSNSWKDQDMVYLFQRPESMPRAIEKANSEMQNDSWLVSLEFEALGYVPSAKLEPLPGKPVWLYRLPVRASQGKQNTLG